MRLQIAPWIPDAIAQGNFKYAIYKDRETTARLLSDLRLRQFWEWYESEGLPEILAPYNFQDWPTAKRKQLERSHSNQFFDRLLQAFEPPDQIERMKQAERKEHLNEIRATTTRLIGLLKGTQFDQSALMGARPLNGPLATGDLPTVAEWLESFKRFPCADTHQRAVRFDDDGTAHELAFDYPLSNVTELLEQVRAWADDPSSLGSWFDVQHTMKQSGTRGLKNYFIGNLGHHFRLNPMRDLTLSYGHIAALVNAALNLESTEEVSEEAARKMIKRMVQKIRRT